MTGMTRRNAIQRVMALMGSAALVGGEPLEAFAFDAATIDQAMAQGVGAFSAGDVALLDEIAETILPQTSTPGAKAAKAGAFMALMVTDVYTAANQQAFRDGMGTLDAACRTAAFREGCCSPRCSSARCLAAGRRDASSQCFPPCPRSCAALPVDSCWASAAPSCLARTTA